MEQLWVQVQPIVINLAVLILSLIAAYIGLSLKMLYAKVSKNKILKSITDDAVAYVYQRFSELANEDKYEKAFERVSLELKKWNITMSTTRIEMALEASYKAMKDSFGSGTVQLPTLEELPGILLDGVGEQDAEQEASIEFNVDETETGSLTDGVAVPVTETEGESVG